MRRLKDSILEKLKVDDITFDAFPIDGSVEEILEFLKSNSFIRIDKKIKLWSDVISEFVNRSGKLFILEDHIKDPNYVFSLKLINTKNQAYHNKFFLYNLKTTGEKELLICEIIDVYDTNDERVDEGKFLNELNKIL